jgi:DNA-directed RNA polymerase II subunit RPB1
LTAIKTSQTGYIQRRLIKALEDVTIAYDMTARNNMGKSYSLNTETTGSNPRRSKTSLYPWSAWASRTFIFTTI